MGAAIAIVALALTIKPTTTEARTCPAHAGGKRVTAQLLCAINQQRTQRGLPALRRDRRLQRAAADQSDAMAARDQLSHFIDGQGPGARLRAAGWRRGWGEVLAKECGSPDPVSDTLDGWLQSPPHRQILLSPAFHWAGVATSTATPKTSCNPDQYWTVDLGQ